MPYFFAFVSLCLRGSNLFTAEARREESEEPSFRHRIKSGVTNPESMWAKVFVDPGLRRHPMFLFLRAFVVRYRSYRSFSRRSNGAR